MIEINGIIENTNMEILKLLIKTINIKQNKNLEI